MWGQKDDAIMSTLGAGKTVNAWFCWLMPAEK
jgi:hypothetical protein